ncbi:hypothetical protein J7L48_00725 [bacterium]|nr:hypothetical protein [bacterium]
MGKKNRKKLNIELDSKKKEIKKQVTNLEDEGEKISLGKGFLILPLIVAAALTLVFYILVFIMVK